jgi:hypothetical protein
MEALHLLHKTLLVFLNSLHQTFNDILSGGTLWYFLSYYDSFLPTYCKCRELVFHLIILSDTQRLDRTPLDK